MGGGIHGEDLFDCIVSPENLFLAWREFRRGKRAKPDIQQFEFALEDNIFQLHEELIARAYRHNSYVAFHVTDPKVRHIHKATVRDRLVHHALFRMLYSLFDRGFITDSYSCRVGKGTHAAFVRLRQFARAMSSNDRRSFWSLKCDVRKFFDSIDHDTLLRLIRRKVSDAGTLWLVERILGSFAKTPGVGLPLGNVTSQLFANIYLNELDRFVKHRLHVHRYLRYCDDFLLLDAKRDALLAYKEDIAKFLDRELRLTLHPYKVHLRTYRQGIDFVGYVVWPYHTVLRTTTKRRLLRRIAWGDYDERSLPAYFGMLTHCNAHTLEQRIRALVSL